MSTAGTHLERQSQSGMTRIAARLLAASCALLLLYGCTPMPEKKDPAAKVSCAPGSVPLAGKKVIAVYLDEKGTGQFDQVEGYATITQGHCIEPAIKTTDDSCPPGYCGVTRQGVLYCYKC